MFQILGLKRLLVAYAVVATAAALIAFIFRAAPQPGFSRDWWDYLWGPVGFGLSAAAGLMWILGETRAFPWLCRRTLLRSTFPDLDGEWKGTLRSNWSRIDARRKGTPEADIPHLDLLPVGTKATIKATLLTVTMTLDSDNRYADSKTLLVGISRDPDTEQVELRYLYEATTKEPKPGDEPSHLGAARLKLRRDGDEWVLEGPYWTNRAWGSALNTAGIAEFRKKCC